MGIGAIVGISLLLTTIAIIVLSIRRLGLKHRSRWASLIVIAFFCNFVAVVVILSTGEYNPIAVAITFTLLMLAPLALLFLICERRGANKC